MIEAVLPTMPAAGRAMGANQVAAVPQGAGIEGIVPGVAINSVGAGLLFGIVMTQLAAGMAQPAAEKAADAKSPEDSETPTQSLPDETSVLASLVPLLVSLQIEPPPTNPVATESPKAVSGGEPISAARPVFASGPTLTPLALATLAEPTATRPSEHQGLLPALSVDAGKDLKAPLLQNQMTGTARASAIPENTPQLSVAPFVPMVPTHNQGKGIPTILATIPTTGEGQKPTDVVPSGPDSGHAVSPAASSSDRTLDQLQALVPSSGLTEATLTKKKNESWDDALSLGSDRSARASDFLPAGNEKIPAEFLAGPAPSPSAPTEAAAVSKTPVMVDAAPTASTPRETIHLQFGPSELGRLTLQVSVQSQQVQATVAVEHRGLGEFLAASQGALDGAMRQHGLRLDELHIETMGNPDVLGAGAGRIGLLDHGQSRQDSPRFDSEPLARRGSESDALITKADILEPLDSRQRINVFA